VIKTTTLLGSALAVVLSAPAMAADFHALAGLQSTPAPLQDGVLAATEGGASCAIGTVTADSGLPGGVCLIGLLPAAAAFAVTNELPVTAAQFLQVHGFTITTLPIPTGP
jgi:hypothetical protein